ncbi:STAS domain-containing protein [uncultured Jatrophihabitans sp.]|uniref:STAS domain-containing protein n=1 Tax=uncultured Jatrophihabitans sp. TaxID=1610747 RepID=UPI0035CB04C3
MTNFAISEPGIGRAIIKPVGRLNMAAAPSLSSTIADVVGAGRPHVVIDLSETVFIDSSGLGALVASLKRCRQAGGDLRLAAPTTQVTMALELTNLVRVLAPSETVDDALARV